MFELLILSLASFFAGMVDAVVGGGGLIMVPALFSLYTTTAPATLFGTNKVASICGTSCAAWQYARTVSIEWGPTLPAIIGALVFAFLGAWAVTIFPSGPLRKALPFILIALAIYTFMRKDLGKFHSPRLSGNKERLAGFALGAVVGFYDGFFGPGTGSFLMFGFVRWFGFDFLKASVSGKLVNIACNFAALVLFGLSGHIWWEIGLLLAITNIAGAQLGSRLALKHGSGFVRRLFLFVVCVLIARTIYDAYLR